MNTQPPYESLLEGREDLIDARQLAEAGENALSMAVYHARHAAENILRSLAEARDIKPDQNWGIPDFIEHIKLDDPDIQSSLDVLKTSDVPMEYAGVKHYIDAVETVMTFVYSTMNLDMEPLPEIKARPKPKPRSNRRNRQPTRKGKRFYVCYRCGVKVPFTHQTARGRVPCPQCGRLMRLVD